MHEALTLICRLASNPAVSATALATLTTNKTVTRFSITVVNRLISRGTLSESLQLQGKHAIVSADTIELSRGLRRRILDNIPHHQGWGDQKQVLLLCCFPFMFIFRSRCQNGLGTQNFDSGTHAIISAGGMIEWSQGLTILDDVSQVTTVGCFNFSHVYSTYWGVRIASDGAKTLLQFWIEVEIRCMNGELFCSCAYIHIFGNKSFSFLCNVLIPSKKRESMIWGV